MYKFNRTYFKTVITKNIICLYVYYFCLLKKNKFSLSHWSKFETNEHIDILKT